MCGDGPDDIWDSIPPWQFPPHVRGWTSCSSYPTQTPSVSPACAGMDLRGRLNDLIVGGFPRMCGDGPRTALATISADAVSPACAGMDRSRASAGKSGIGFPRMCGDGPCALGGSASRERFPPHVRGWTRVGAGVVDLAQVSPACAGMDRVSSPGQRLFAGFPRMCGDGPRRGSGPDGDPAFPPHVRGWTGLERSKHV